jgi:hypothetical protein
VLVNLLGLVFRVQFHADESGGENKQALFVLNLSVILLPLSFIQEAL